MLLQTPYANWHERTDVHLLEGNTKTKLIYASIAAKFCNLAAILSFYHEIICQLSGNVF